MTKEILLLTLTLLGFDETRQALEQGELMGEDAKRVNELLAYTNYVVREVTTKFCPLYECITLKSDDKCQIYYKDFDNEPIAIKWVKDRFNETFNLYPEYIKVGKPENQYRICYEYTPKTAKTIDDEVHLPLGISFQTICYGVASEYTLSKLLYDEAAMWQDKFKNSLESTAMHLPERRFKARKLK